MPSLNLVFTAETAESNFMGSDERVKPAVAATAGAPADAGDAFEGTAGDMVGSTRADCGETKAVSVRGALGWMRSELGIAGALAAERAALLVNATRGRLMGGRDCTTRGAT